MALTETALEFASRFGRFVDGMLSARSLVLELTPPPVSAASPTPYHVCREVGNRLVAHGFVRLSESQPWNLRLGGKYYYTRNSSTLVAFCVGEQFTPGNGFKLVGAHTDSPALKLKPISKRGEGKLGYLQVGIETYGGGLWHTWLDRDLGLAGRVVVKQQQDGGKFVHRLVHLNQAILRIPSLCIHLQSADERAALKINPEDHLSAVLGLQQQQGEGDVVNSRIATELLTAISRELGVSQANIVDFDLTLCDTQKASVAGIHQEFLCAPRLDNLMHCFTSIEALLRLPLANDKHIALVALFDHEEIGSTSTQGAGSPIIRDALVRVSQCLNATSPSFQELHKIALSRSVLVSADGAHAVHPNFVGKHEAYHQPRINQGTVIKTNQNQRYATNGTTGFLLREVARKAKLPIQEFVVKQDSPCGSTIGPILAANLGVRCVDVGIPQLSMHSIRETCGVEDLHTNTQLLHAFFIHGLDIDENLTEENFGDDGEEDFDKV